ncbi:MAG: AMP-binding protein [Pseudomonadales bacterium]|nr:AMP-binding protein [Pseudomonadales bacterium]
MDVRTLMKRAALDYADLTAISHGDRQLTFAEAWNRGIRLANGLVAMGLKPDDRVGVLEDNSIEAADFYNGCAIANIVRVPLYARNSIEAHSHMLSHTNCKVLMVSANYAHEVDELLGQLPDLKRIFVRDDNYETWLASQSDVEPDIEINSDDVFIIRHTGGTTGPSKGVSYTHRSWLNAGRDWFYNLLPVEPGDKCLHIGPISHGSGYQYMPVWLSGGCNVMVDHFDASSTMDLMEREGIAYAFMVPTMVSAVVREGGSLKRDWSQLKCLLIGAAPIADSTALAAREIFGDTLYQAYGQTEVVPVAFMGPSQWFGNVEGSTPLRACGLAPAFAQVAIWDEENQPLPRGEVGEIVAKSDGQMTGFWNNEKATAERIVDGWVKTGDLGRMDDNGYLYIVDRADDMIISGGYNIWPMELENVISDIPEIIEVAVFGVPHDKWGETPHAVCVVPLESNLTEAYVIELCAEQLGSYKKPSAVTFTQTPLPLSPVGKIMRKNLREPFWEGVDRRVSGS